MQWPTRCSKYRELLPVSKEFTHHQGRICQLLQIVQHQQHVSLTDVLEKGWRRPALTRYSKGFPDGAPHDICCVGRCQWYEVNAVRAGSRQAIGPCNREPRFTRPSGAG